jgi:hypothetical protein
MYYLISFVNATSLYMLADVSSLEISASESTMGVESKPDEAWVKRTRKDDGSMVLYRMPKMLGIHPSRLQ